MKRFLSILIILSLLLGLATTFVACGQKPEESTTTTTTTEPEPPKEDVIEIIDGYIWVNGVNTGIKAEDCPHVWETVTTAPTCSSEGYDTISCQLCGNSAKTNYTSKLQHTYSTTYSVDDAYHWFACTVCGDAKDKSAHTPDANDICTTCEMPTTATPGVVYDVSADGTYAEVIGYNGTATKVKIASEYKGLPIKTIYREAFQNNRNITSVVIPDTVTSIGDYAFSYCSNLNSVVIGDSVTSIGDYAFSRCTNLSSVVIGDSVTSIGGYAFYYCSNLNSVVIPDGVTSIGNYAFSRCSNLSSVVIGDSVTSIGNYAFNGCDSSLYTEYEYGKYVKSGDNPYAVLIELTYKNISTYEIHEDTKIIAYGVFRDCNRLTSITIPDSVISIGDYAFYYCINLSSVVIPDSVTSIGDAAFHVCSNLSSVVIGDSVTSIGSSAFGDCFNLTDVYYTGTQEEWNKIEISSMNNKYLNNATIHYNYVPP